MKNIVTALVLLGTFAAQAQSSGPAIPPGSASSKVSLTRTVKVERLSATEYLFECTAIWGNVNPQAHYTVSLNVLAQDMDVSHPNYSDVSPQNRRVTLTDPSRGSLTVELNPNGTLVAHRAFTHSSATLSSYPLHFRYCEGNAHNYTDALPLPRFFVWDYAMP